MGRCAWRRGSGKGPVGRHAGRTGWGMSRTGGTGHTRRSTLRCVPGGRHLGATRCTVRTRGWATGGNVRSARASQRGTTAGGRGTTGVCGGRSALGRVRSGRSTRGRTGKGTGGSLPRPARGVRVGCLWRTARRRTGWRATRVVSSSGVNRGRLTLGVGGTPTEQVLAVTVGLFFRVVMRRVRVRTDGSLRRL